MALGLLTFIVFQFSTIAFLLRIFLSFGGDYQRVVVGVSTQEKYRIQRRKLRFFNSDVCFPNIAFDAPAYEMGKKGLWLPFFACLLSTFPSANQDSIQYLTIQNSIFILLLRLFLPLCPVMPPTNLMLLKLSGKLD